MTANACVSRERERESDTLNQKSTALFYNLTHTSKFIEKIEGKRAFICDIKDRLFKK